MEISIGIIFLKSTMMKSVIKSNSMRGISEAVTPIIDKILSLTEKATCSRSSSFDDVPQASFYSSVPISCPCESHLEHVDQNIVVDGSSSKIFSMIFGDDSAPLWARIDRSNSNFGRNESKWVGEMRTVSYMKPMSNPLLKLKEIQVDETLTISSSKENQYYVVNTQGVTLQVPYGDCFTTETRICISFESQATSRVIISNTVNFTKSTIMKSIIRSSALKGLADTANEIAKNLQCDPAAPIEEIKAIDRSVDIESVSTFPYLKIIVIVIVSLFIGILLGKFMERSPTQNTEWSMEWQNSFNHHTANQHSIQEFLKHHLSSNIPSNNTTEYRKLVATLNKVKDIRASTKELYAELDLLEKFTTKSLYLLWRSIDEL